MSELDSLKARIAAIEAGMSKGGRKAQDEGKEDGKEDGKETLASEIAALERQLRADDDEEDEDDEDEAEEVEAKSKKGADEDAEKKTASEAAPAIEDDITNDRHREVERLEHGTELTTGTMMLQVAPTRSEYQAKLKLASARLDRVADYLERHGRRELAFRIDRIADAIDAKVKGGK